MNLSNKLNKKKYKVLSLGLFFVVIFFTSFSLMVEKSNSQSSSCNFNNVSGDGKINLNSSCSIDNDGLDYAFFGPSNANDLVIKTGATLTIGSDSSLVLKSGQKIYVDGGQIIINKNNDGSSGAAGVGALLRGSLYLEDDDLDGYADNETYIYDTGSSNTVVSGEKTYIKADPVNFNINVEEGILIDCDPSDPNVFIAQDCELSDPEYSEWEDVGICGEYFNRIQRRQRTWLKTIVKDAACGGEECGVLTGTEIDDSLSCGECNSGDVSYCGEGVCTNSVECNGEGEFPVCVENNSIYWYDNDDGDAYGDPNDVSANKYCVQPSGYIDNNSDCDDTSSSITTSGSRYRYSTNSVDCDETCLSFRQQQTCSSGVWSGTYSYSTCNVNNCSSGTYCNNGSCSTCTAGYYCPGDNNRSVCGSINKYSLAGKSSCSSVSSGYYTTGGTTTTRTGQSICPIGSSCSSGVKTLCLSGTYANTTGMTSCISCPAGTCSAIGASSCYSDTRYYRDSDGDGEGDPNNYTDSCSVPSGYVSNNNDCDDSNSSIKNGSTRTRYACISVSCGTASGNGTQTCTNGTWVGSYTDSNPCSSVSTRTRFADNDPCGSSCTSQTQTCQSNGAWSGTYAYSSCTDYSTITVYRDSDGDGYGNPSNYISNTYCSNTIPSGYVSNSNDCDDGSYSIKNTYSGTKYDVSSVSCGTACASVTRTCSNGSWDGNTSYTADSCTASTRTRFADNDPCGSSCTSQTQTCQSNGAWSGTYAYSSCTDYSTITVYRDSDGDGYGNPSNYISNTYCSNTIPSGYVSNSNDCDDGSYSIKNTYSVTKYNVSSVSCGTACASVTRTCSNGSWDGNTSYTADSCTASTRTRFADNDPCGSSCTSQTQTCQLNGAWSGTYSYTSCTSYSKTRFYYDNDGDGDGDPNDYTDNYCSAPANYVSNNNDCDDNNGSISYGSTRTRYACSSVSCGTANVSQSQTCQSGGTWSGTYSLSSACSSASTRTRYADNDPCGSSCTSQTQTCQSNGIWSGTYAYSSCTSYSKTRFYHDNDGDGDGDPNDYTDNYCSAPANYVSNNNDCDDNNSSISYGSTRTRYACSSVSCGTANVSQSQTCQSGGTWSGTYSLSSSCSSVSTRTRYSTDTGGTASVCPSETQTCQSNGSWSGSYSYASCTIYTCAAGSFYYNYGCRTCLAGYRCPGNNAGYICGAGEYSTAGSSVCTACPTGAYSTSSGSSSCTYCSSGSTNSGTGNTSCPDCSAGDVSGFSYNSLSNGSSQSVSKSACYRSNGGSLDITVTCNNGSITYTGSTDVPNCDSGYLYRYGSYYTDTFGCYRVCVLATCSGTVTYNGFVFTPGTMSHNTTSSFDFINNTYTCDVGVSCHDGTYTITSMDCDCKAGYYESSPGTCVPCPVGTYSSSGASSCIGCSTGYTSPFGSDSSTDCFTCGAGYYSSNNTSCTYVGKGYYSGTNDDTRYSCTPGHYCSGYYNTSNLSCPVGTYNNIYRATSCTSCSAGTYAYGVGNTSCSSCSSGYTCPAGSDYSGDCFTCGSGYYSSNNSSCSVAGTGYYSPSGDYRRYMCLTGTYNPYSTSGSCYAPSGDYYVPTAGASSKTYCQGAKNNCGYLSCMASYHITRECDSSCYPYSGSGSCE